LSTIPELNFWQQLLLAGLALISFVYVFYFKIWVTLAAGSDLVFVLALGVASASVAAPTLFEAAATRLVERSALSSALVAADQKVTAIEALPRDLIDRALLKLGYEPDPKDSETNAFAENPGLGPFESRIRPSVEALVASVLRAAGFVISTLLLLMALTLRASTSTARALQSLARRTANLEDRALTTGALPPSAHNEGHAGA
jgi:hypothetical protein